MQGDGVAHRRIPSFDLLGRQGFPGKYLPWRPRLQCKVTSCSTVCMCPTSIRHPYSKVAGNERSF
eukprot:3136080-Rhodomonas_salina.2